MNYQEFKQHIVSELQRELGTEIRIILQDILKNNDTHLDGLTILAPDHNVAPTIYLNHYFQQYEDGRTLPDIRQDILDVYHASCPLKPIDVSFFTDYDKVKSLITFKLIHYERNRALLEDVPHYRFLDLAIVFNCLFGSNTAGNATILIRDRHLAFWDITQDDLYALAAQNTPRLLPYELRSMSELLGEMFFGESASPALPDDALPFPMYILSNERRLNGAACILYKNLLDDFARQQESDLYLLPSSVHEMLILPVRGETSRIDLSQMVQDVNSSQVAREEILSDHIYYYSRETGRITM